MSVHDWTRVGAGTFHDFHNSWIVELKRVLNQGLLPQGYYAQSEQDAWDVSPDVLTLQAADEMAGPPFRSGGVAAVAQSPPQVSIVAVADEDDAYTPRRRTLVIRHESGDEIVALLEILSAGNKNRAPKLERFLDKVASALSAGYHLLIIDLHPPGRFDPQGIHGAIWQQFDSRPYTQPANKPLTLAAYTAGLPHKAYVEPIAVADVLPKMPLFLDVGWYVPLPLEETYVSAFRTIPDRWQKVLE